MDNFEAFLAHEKKLLRVSGREMSFVCPWPNDFQTWGALGNILQKF
jgi:hypothetical protein